MPQKIYFRSSNIEPYPLQVVGESNYIANILSVIPFQDGTGVEIDDLFCELIPEDNNTYDKLAVKVTINGVTVGYLSRQDARDYRTRLSQLSKTPGIGTCYASIRGGFGEESERRYGVRIDLDLTHPLEIIPAKPATIPPPATLPKNTPAAAQGISFTQRVIKFLRLAFSRAHWWKTVLVIIVLIWLIQAIIS